MAVTFPTHLRNKDILSVVNKDASMSIDVVATTKNTKLVTKPSKLDVLEKYVNPVSILSCGLMIIVGFSIYAIPVQMMADSLKSKIEAQITTNSDFNKGHVDLKSAYADLDMRAIGDVKTCAINTIKKANINAFNLWTYRDIAVQQHARFLENDCSEYAKAESFSRFPKDQSALYRKTVDKVIHKDVLTMTSDLMAKDKALDKLYD